MKQLTAEQIQANWDKFIDNINRYITGERKHKMIAFYKKHQDRLMIMPASSVDHYHSAWPGGYVEHVNRVLECALRQKSIWQAMGSPLNFTEEEMAFAAINHDLGKMGSEEQDYYVPNPSEWHRKNQGKIYEHNNELSKMPVPDRTILLLANAGITFNETEYIAMKTHDGMYDDANKPYLLGYGYGQKLKSALPYVLHMADMMASRIEFEEWRDNYRNEDVAVAKPAAKKDSAKTQISAESANRMLGAFDELFKTKQ